MKTRICKITALCLFLCLSLSALSACTQTVQIRFVDKDGNDRFSVPAADTAQTTDNAASEISSQATENATADAVLPERTTAAAPVSVEAPATQAPATQAPATQPPVTQPPATQAATTEAPATQPPATEPPATTAPAGFEYRSLNKKGDLYKAEGTGKIWAKIVGSCYMLFKDIDAPNEWGEKGKVYELYVTYIRVGENYSMWSDGYWELSEDGTVLKLTPVNQSNNGNIGADVGSTKTFTADDGRFTIPVSFEQGGGTEVILDLRNALS